MNFNNDFDDEDIVAEINMTPLIDIMLVLLILFMVTSSVSIESGLDLDLPKVQGETKSKEGKALIISLHPNGEISLQGQKVPYENLKEEITKGLEREGTKLVILEGDQKSRLGRAIEIIDIAKLAGADQFAIAAEKEN